MKQLYDFPVDLGMNPTIQSLEGRKVKFHKHLSFTNEDVDIKHHHQEVQFLSMCFL